MNHNFTPASRTYANILTGSAYVAAAGTDGAMVTDGAEIDTKGYRSVRIILLLGVIAANGVITSRVKNSATTAVYGSGTVDVIGSALSNSADTDDNKVIIHEIHNPQRRYLKHEYQRTVGNVTINGIIVELFNPVHQPVTQATADVEASQVLNNPTPSAT